MELAVPRGATYRPCLTRRGRSSHADDRPWPGPLIGTRGPADRNTGIPSRRRKARAERSAASSHGSGSPPLAMQLPSLDQHTVRPTSSFRQPSVERGPQAHCGPSSLPPMQGSATLVTAALIPRAMAGQLGRFRLPGRTERRGAKRRSPVRGVTVVFRKGRRTGKGTGAAEISAALGSARSVSARCGLG